MSEYSDRPALPRYVIEIFAQALHRPSYGYITFFQVTISRDVAQDRHFNSPYS